MDAATAAEKADCNDRSKDCLNGRLYKVLSSCHPYCWQNHKLSWDKLMEQAATERRWDEFCELRTNVGQFKSEAEVEEVSAGQGGPPPLDAVRRS